MWAMATVIRLAGNEEDKGKGGKGNGNGDMRVGGKGEDGRQVNCNGNKEGDCNSNEGGKQATVTATKRAMGMAMRLVNIEEGNCNGGKSNGDGNKDGWQTTTTRVMTTRVAGKQR